MPAPPAPITLLPASVHAAFAGGEPRTSTPEPSGEAVKTAVDLSPAACAIAGLVVPAPAAVLGDGVQGSSGQKRRGDHAASDDDEEVEGAQQQQQQQQQQPAQPDGSKRPRVADREEEPSVSPPVSVIASENTGGLPATAEPGSSS